jgi:spore germination protein YaaH
MNAFIWTLTFLLLAAKLSCQTNSSIHEQQSSYYHSLGTMTDAQYDKLNAYQKMPPRNTKRSSCPLDKIVFGWHPYWVGSAYNNYDWDLLSDLSFFSYEVDAASGNANSTHNWATSPVIDLAKNNGVRVNLCVTLFSNHAVFFNSATAQQTLISNLISMIQSRGANGVNIDFEGIPSSQKTNFTNFMINLSNQMHTAIPGSQVSTVLYAVDWNNIFDVATLSSYVDLFIIMGYDYYWSGSSNAGPNDPLYHFISNSYQYSLSRSITDYLSKGLDPQQLVLGLPYYGREWPVSANVIPTTTTGTGSARTYKVIKNNTSGHYTNQLMHEASQTPYYSFNDGSSWRQCFALDDESFSERLDVVLLRNLAGMGIWALGYDDGYTELWDVIEQKMTVCRNQPCSDTLHDMGGSLRNYYNKEDYIYTINPQNGAFPLSVNFTAFDIELNYDYLKLYDGTDTSAPLIGTYTGSASPGAFTANSGALTLWFDADGATTNSGWELVYDCNLPASTLADTVLLGSSSGTQLNCGNSYHWLFDSGGSGGNYANNENLIQTFCNSDSSKAVRISFRPNPSNDVQIKLSSTPIGNDYIYIYNGADTSANLVGVYTGTTDSAPQPGTFISSEHCLTVQMKTDASSSNTGFNARLYCVDVPSTNAVQYVGGTAGTAVFADDGGLSGDYSNDQNYLSTFCPDASAPATEVVWASFVSNSTIERNWDYLYVFDGPDTDNSRLIAVYTGDSVNSNTLGIIKATTSNVSGCLTFQFFSDVAVTAAGWEAQITTGQARLDYAADDCAAATTITAENTSYAGSTMLATGQPSGSDPALNISLASLPECSGANTITRLENTVWFTFTTVDTFCVADQVAVRLDNISCQSISNNGSGVQFVLYETGSCPSGGLWGQPLYCADKLTNGDSVVITSLLQPSTSYYIMLDGFSGQHCNFDLRLENKDSSNCSIITDIVQQQLSVSYFKAFPNPTTGFLNFEYINAPQGNASIKITDVSGRLIQQISTRIYSKNWEYSVDVSALPKGFYIYSIETQREVKAGKFQKID